MVGFSSLALDTLKSTYAINAVFTSLTLDKFTCHPEMGNCDSKDGTAIIIK